MQSLFLLPSVVEYIKIYKIPTISYNYFKEMNKLYRFCIHYHKGLNKTITICYCYFNAINNNKTQKQ